MGEVGGRGGGGRGDGGRGDGGRGEAVREGRRWERGRWEGAIVLYVCQIYPLCSSSCRAPLGCAARRSPWKRAAASGRPPTQVAPPTRRAKVAAAASAAAACSAGAGPENRTRTRVSHSRLRTGEVRSSEVR